MLIPVGFGAIFLNDILAHNINTFGNAIWICHSNMTIFHAAMLIPVFGMFVGLLVAIFVSYRKPRRISRCACPERTQSISSELKCKCRRANPTSASDCQIYHLDGSVCDYCNIGGAALFRFDDSGWSGGCRHFKLCGDFQMERSR